MDASSGKNELNTPFKLTGLDLMFGMPRSEWVTLYEKGADIERGIASMERVLDDFPLLICVSCWWRHLQISFGPK